MTPAKLNLFLSIKGKRKDGYHEIRTVMHLIDLCDTMYFQKARETSVTFEPPVVDARDNLVRRAIDEVCRQFGAKKHLKVLIKKRIPVGGGLGGGSSNAAATVVAMKQLYNLKMGVRDYQEIAERLGSDVAFFMLPFEMTALCFGRGEHVLPLNSLTRVRKHFVIIPGESLSTAEVYKRYDRAKRIKGPDIFEFIALLRKGRGFENLMFNALEPPAFELMPRLKSLKRRMLGLGFSQVMMTGSGSTLFGVCNSRAQARRLAEKIPGALTASSL